MGKALQVVVIFEFAGIESADSPEADQIIDEISHDVGSWGCAWKTVPVAGWVDEARIREGVEV